LSSGWRKLMLAPREGLLHYILPTRDLPRAFREVGKP